MTTPRQKYSVPGFHNAIVVEELKMPMNMIFFVDDKDNATGIPEGWKLCNDSEGLAPCPPLRDFWISERDNHRVYEHATYQYWLAKWYDKYTLYDDEEQARLHIRPKREIVVEEVPQKSK